MNQNTIVYRIADSTDKAPVPLSWIPNEMGINLCCVSDVVVTKRDDGQIVSILFNFMPETETNNV